MHLTDGTVDGIPTGLWMNHLMMNTQSIYCAIRKALDLSGFLIWHTNLGLVRNDPVEHNGILAI